MTFDRLKNEREAEHYKKPDQRFYKNETNLDMLKRVAENSEECNIMPCMRKQNQPKEKPKVKELREPDRLNFEGPYKKL